MEKENTFWDEGDSCSEIIYMLWDIFANQDLRLVFAKVRGCNAEKIPLIPKGLGNPTCLVNESEDGWTQMYDV